jgi:hypothetical protein
MFHTYPVGSFVTNERNAPMNPLTDGNPFERGLHVLEQRNDPELSEAYRRYMQHLEQLLGKDKMDAYAHVYQQDLEQLNPHPGGGVRTPEERAMQDTVTADPEVDALFNKYIALAKGHGLIVPEIEAPVKRKHFWS